MILSIIVAVAENSVIGKDNALIWHLSADLKRFKQLTMGNPILMGRKTYESIGRVLPGRRNVVISANESFMVPGGEVVRSVSEALELLKEEKEVFIIGGGSVYREMWPYADRVYLTLVHTAPEGDTKLPEINATDWEEVKREDHQADEKNEFDYSFIDYIRREEK